jgi:predicted transcriptional regulator
MNGIKTPVDRETCEKFEESTDRVKRDFWKKWKGCIYVAEGGYSLESGQRNAVNYESFITADNLVCEDSSRTQYRADEEHKLKDLPTIDELPIIQGLPAADELSTTKECDPPAEEYELISEECETIDGDELIAELDEDTAEECEDTIEGCEDPVENQEVPAGHDPIDRKEPTHRTNKQKEINKQKYTTTRSLILQALSNGISRLKDIAYFADVDPSTAHYHLGNLVKEYRVTKVSWGEYIFSDQFLDSDGRFLNKSGRTFEKLLKNFSHSGRGWRGFEGLHPLERNILMDILSKENKYEQFSERELARRSNISRYAAKKYTENLEKNKLIMIKRENNQLVFTPTEVLMEIIVYGIHLQNLLTW